jgi:hypothetical protein
LETHVICGGPGNEHGSSAQRPAASLQDDDRINAAFAMLSLKKFREVKDAVMRGFVKCSDGRLYHVFLSKVATDAYRRKVAFQKKRGADAKRLRQWRESQKETADVALGTRYETQNDTHVETRFVADRNGKEGEGNIKEKALLRRAQKKDHQKVTISRRIGCQWLVTGTRRAVRLAVGRLKASSRNSETTGPRSREAPAASSIGYDLAEPGSESRRTTAERPDRCGLCRARN